MRFRLVLIILPFLFSVSCGLLFKSGIEKATNILYHGITPDTCDITIIYDFIDFREDSLRFPKYSWIQNRIQLQSRACQDSYDSINAFEYGVDTADLFMIKNFTNAENENYSLRKYYRLIFSNDTLSNISSHLITSQDNYY